MTSVNTNASATTALRTLQQTNKALDTTQNRISTGLKIGEAKDNAAYWSISTTLKSDNKSLATVKDALGLGAATIDVAYQGLNKAKDVLDEIKAKLTSATQAGVDRKAVQSDIDALQDQLKSIATSSNFSGENWLAVNTASDALSKSVVASYSRNADNAVSIGKVDIDIAKVALFDTKPDSSVGILSTQTTLRADGAELNVGGNAATGNAPALNGLDTAQASAGLDVGAAAAAKVTLGTFSAAGLDKADKFTFNLSLNGSAAKAITVSLTTATTAGGLATLIQNAINAPTAFDTGAVTVSSTGGVISITSGTSGSASSVAISDLKVVDGDGTVSTIAGYTAPALSGVAKLGTGSANKVAVTFSVAGTPPAILADGESLQFKFTYNGDLYETSAKTITAATDSATSDLYTVTLQNMIDGAKRVSDNVTLGTGKISVAKVSATAIDISTIGKGPSQTVSITSVTVDGASASTTEANGLIAASGGYGPANAIATTGAIAAPGSDGDTISFDMTLYSDNATATGSTAVKKTISFVSSATQATNAANLQAALNESFGVGTLAVDTSTGAISTIKTGPNVGILIANASVKDGDGVRSSTLGMSTGAIKGVGRDLAATAIKATVTSTSAFAGPLTLDAGDSIKFNVTLNDKVSAVSIDKALIDSTLGGTDGTIADADKYAAVVNAALTKAGVATVEATNDNGVLKLQTKTEGAATLTVSDTVASSGASTISVDEIDITSAGFNALSEADKSKVLTAYITVVNEAITKVTSSAASLGSVAKRIDLQQSFVDTLMDTIDKGVGNLIDADLSEESTRLQALQTKQQLGVQALSIANSGTQQILRLFQ